MSPALQAAPEPDKRAALYYAASCLKTGDDGGGAPPRSGIGGFEVQLINDSLTRSALHRLVLFLPLTILIFQQALLHQSEKIKLPIVELELKVYEVIPIFLMLISFMLYRALRYSRIVLWNVIQRPHQLEEIGDIALDDTEAYKLKSAYYEDVLDPMAAALIPPLSKSNSLIKILGWSVLVAFNIIRSWLAYVLIFLIVAVMAFYVSRELVTVIGTLKLDALPLHWRFEPTATIETLIFCLCAFLLILAWLNSAGTALIALWPLLRGLRFLFVGGFGLLWRTNLFRPLRRVFRGLFSAGKRLRERRRDQVFAKQTARHLLREQKFLAAEPKVAEFRIRRKVYSSLLSLQSGYMKIESYFGKEVLHGGNDRMMDENSEWWKVNKKYNLYSINFNISQLEVLAHLEPLEFLEGDWQKLRARLAAYIVAYDKPPDDTTLGTLKKPDMSGTERDQAADAIRARNLTITSQAEELSQFRNDLSSEIARVITGESVPYHPRVDELRLIDKARAYFNQTELSVGGFREPAPVRGASDSKLFTSLLGFLARAGGLEDVPKEKSA